MKAYLSNYRQSPRKVRLMAGLVRGKSVPDALETLKYTNKRATTPVYKLIASAAANAKDVDPRDLIVSAIRIDKGIVLKRIMPRAMGRAAGIKKRSSHITVELSKK